MRATRTSWPFTRQTREPSDCPDTRRCPNRVLTNRGDDRAGWGGRCGPGVNSATALPWPLLLPAVDRAIGGRCGRTAGSEAWGVVAAGARDTVAVLFGDVGRLRWIGAGEGGLCVWVMFAVCGAGWWMRSGMTVGAVTATVAAVTSAATFTPPNPAVAPPALTTPVHASSIARPSAPKRRVPPRHQHVAQLREHARNRYGKAPTVSVINA